MTALRTLASQTAIHGLGSIVARFLGFVLVTALSANASHGQNTLEGEYTDGRQGLLLKPDSTFSYSFYFCMLSQDRAFGTWSVRNSILHLTYIEQMDTFITTFTRRMAVNGREYEVSMEERTLRPSMAEEPVTIHGEPSQYCCWGRGPRPTILVQRKDRLYLANDSGKILHTKVRSHKRGWTKKWKRTYFAKL